MIEEVRINRDFSRISNCNYYNDARDPETNEVSRQKVINSSTFFDNLNNLVNLEDEILPINCRYVKRIDNQHRLIVTEDRPKIRTCSFNIDFERTIELAKMKGNTDRFNLEKFVKDNKRPYKLRLSFPYIIYVFFVTNFNRICQARVFFRTSPLSGMYDYLLNPNLLNVSDDNTICIGNIEKDKNYVKNINEEIDDYIGAFWSNHFNTDYNEKSRLYENVDGVSDLLTWAYYTSVDPMFIFNVKWKILKLNFKNMIDKYHHSYNENFNYSVISSLFTTPIKQEKKKGISYSNFISSIAVKDRIIEIGDQIQFKNKEVFVEGFSSNNVKEGNINAYSIPRYIDLSIDGKIISFKLTFKFKDYLNKLLKSEDSSELKSTIIKNGNEVKSNDIVCLNNGDDSYRKVRKIRKAIDGVEEIKISNYFYVASELDAEIIDIDNLEFKGKIINKDSEYLIYDINNNTILNTDYKFIEFNIDDSSSLSVVFESNGRTIEIHKSYRGDYNFIPIEEVKKLPNIVRYGLRLYMGGGFYSGNDILLHKDNWEYSPTIKDLINENCLTKEKLSIKSYDIDIEFSVGDDVIIPNWDDPLEALNIKKITEIKWDHEFNNNNINITINLINSKGETSSLVYYEEGILKVGSIRKISSFYGGVYTGTKIKAKVGRLPMFLKKDTNVIIGFITDTGREPLVLCSNYCTIWFNDLHDKFELITPKNKKYENLKLSPIALNKVKLQQGDLINFNNQIYINPMNHNNAIFRVGEMFEIGNYTSYITNSRFYDNSKFYGLLNPRYTKTEIYNSGNTNGFPDLHGSYIHNSNSKFSFSECGVLNDV